MSKLSSLSDSPTGGRVVSVPNIPQTRSATSLIADQTDVLHREVGDLFGNTAQLRRDASTADLEDRQIRASAKSGQQLLDELSNLGLAWRDIARMAQVSVPAVQKWRRGDGMAGKNRLRLAKLDALIELLETQFIDDPASWLEMPIRDDVSISRIDLVSDDRFDLVLDLARINSDPNIAENVLDSYRPDWRDSLVDTNFESYVASDGVVSIRPASR